MNFEDPEKLIDAIRHAEEHRDRFLKGPMRAMAKMPGKYYKPGTESLLENHAYEFISLVVPKIIFDNPRVAVGTRRRGTQGDVALGINYALNRWIHDTDIKGTLTDIATDGCFCWGVTMTRLAENETLVTPDFEGDEVPAQSSEPPQTGTVRESVPMWPVVDRIPQSMFGVDPAATCDDDCKFKFHKWVKSKDALIEEAREEDGWDLEAVRALATTEDPEKLGRLIGKDVPERDEVYGWEVWVPGADMPEGKGVREGFHGMLYVVAESMNDSGERRSYQLRKPRPFYGPRQGPYQVFGVYPVPGEFWPLAPITAVWEQVEDHELQAKALTRQAKDYKRILVTNDAKLARKIKDTPDGHVAVTEMADDVQRVLSTVEAGGTEEQVAAQVAMHKERVDRVSGITEAQRGNIAGKGTATEQAIADEASSVRMGFLKRQFADYVQSVLSAVAFYMYHDDNVILPLGDQAAEELGIPEGQEAWYEGGDHDPDSGATFDDLELTIEPYSMERTDEGVRQARMMQGIQLITQLLPFVQAFPGMNWEEIFSKVGDTINWADLGEVMGLDDVRAQQMAPAAGDQPRMSKDLGAAGMAPGNINGATAMPDLRGLMEGGNAAL